MDYCSHHRRTARPSDTTDWSDDKWDGGDVRDWIAAQTGIDPRIVGRVLDAETDWLHMIGRGGD